MEREQIVYSSLLTLALVLALADPEPMLSRLVGGYIALAFAAGVRALAPLVDAVNKGGELSYTMLALIREQIAHEVQLATDALPGGFWPTLRRCYLVWSAAASPWPSLVYWCAYSCTALLISSRAGRQLSYTTLAMEREQIVYCSLLTLAWIFPADAAPMLSRLVRD